MSLTNRVLVKGWKHTLRFEDVYDLEDRNKSKPLSEDFHRFWKPTPEQMSSAYVVKVILLYHCFHFNIDLFLSINNIDISSKLIGIML